MKNGWHVPLAILACFAICETQLLGKDMFITFSHASEYNSNVFGYSGTDRASYKNNLNVNRFKGVKLLYDVVEHPELNLEFSEQWFAVGKTRLGSGLKAYVYVNNPDKSYVNGRFYVKQYFGNNQMIHLRFDFIPDYFVRTLYDPETTGNDRYVKAYFEKNEISLKYWRRFSQGLSGWIKYSLEFKDYNVEFAERDCAANGVDLSLNCAINRWIKVSPRLGFAFVRAAGGTSGLANRPDTSRDEINLGLNLEVLPRKNLTVDCGYHFTWLDYTTGHSTVVDPFHAGRKDDNQEIELTVGYDPSKRVTVTARYAYESKHSSVPENLTTLAEESILGFAAHSLRFGCAMEF